MKIGIIGPNRLDDTFKGKLVERKEMLKKVAEIVSKSGNEIVLTPDKESLLEYFGREYLNFGGKKIWLIAPMEDDAEKYLCLDIGEIVSCINWKRQADEFNKISDVFICTGYSWGAMKEIACSKYFHKKKIYVLKEFISEKLPNELNFLLEYITINDLDKIVKGL